MFFKKPYFRPGAGTIIYNDAGLVLNFERSELPSVWQLQQGGMDEGEDILDTLWRELKEETGLTRDNFLAVHEYPEWTIYEYPAEMRARFGQSNTLGQVHRWFYLKLNPAVAIDLARASDKEFRDWRWSTFSELVKETGPMKQHIYERLNSYYRESVLPK